MPDDILITPKVESPRRELIERLAHQLELALDLARVARPHGRRAAGGRAAPSGAPPAAADSGADSWRRHSGHAPAGRVHRAAGTQRRQHLRRFLEGRTPRLMFIGPGGVGKSSLGGWFTREACERNPSVRALGFRAPFDLDGLYNLVDAAFDPQSARNCRPRFKPVGTSAPG